MVESIGSSKICRVCLNESINFLSLFEEQYSIEQMIECCANVTVSQNDGLPKWICTDCYNELNIAYGFKQKCENADARLKQFIESRYELAKEDTDEINNLELVQTLQLASTNEHIIETINDISDATISAKDEDIYAAMSAVFFEDSQQPPLMSTDSLEHFQNNLLEMPNKEADSVEVASQLINLDPLNMNAITIGSDQNIISNTDNSIVESKAKLQCSKSHRSRLDLDKCLQERKLKRKTENLLERQTKKMQKRTRKNKKLLKQPQKCLDCGKVFNYSGYLEAHMRTHTGERPYCCTMCNLKFVQAGNLALHIRKHTGERPYQCEICSKQFTTSSNLKAHHRIHSQDRQYVCGHCDYAFKTVTALQSHEGTHTGEKNHQCKYCDKTFYKVAYLNVHIRTVHIGDKRHRCTECGKVFSNSSNLICHFRIHTGEKPFACAHCNRRFNQSSALARHSKQNCKNHKNNIEKCEEPIIAECDNDNIMVEDANMDEPIVTTVTVEHQSTSHTIHSISNMLAEKEIDVCDETTADTIPNIISLHSAGMYGDSGGADCGGNIDYKIPISNYHHFDPYHHHGSYMGTTRIPATDNYYRTHNATQNFNFSTHNPNYFQ